MIACKECGFPRVHKYFIQWNDNGTMTLRFNPNFRVLIIEADFFTKLVTAIEDELSLPVRQMMFETQRDASRVVIGADLSSFHGLGKKRPFKWISIRFLDSLAGYNGMCFSHSIGYRPGREYGSIIRNSYDRELMAANIMGALEVLDGVAWRHEWQRKGNDDYLYAKPDTHTPQPVLSVPREGAPLKPGNRHIERCPRCDTPLAMRDFKWMQDEGIIMDIRKGVRMIFNDFYTCSVILEELSRELGPAFAPIVVDTQRALFIRHIWEEFMSRHRGIEQPPKHELYNQVLETLALRGQGNPVEHSIEEGRV